MFFTCFAISINKFISIQIGEQGEGNKRKRQMKENER